MNNTRVMCKTALNTTQFEGTTQGGDVKWFQFRIWTKITDYVLH